MSFWALLLPAPCYLKGPGRNRGPGGTYRPTRPRRGGVARPGLDFPLFWPLTCRAPLWHNVTRRPRRGILGFLPQGFRPPSRPTLSFFYTGYIYIPCKNGKTGNPDRCRDRQTDGFAVLRGRGRKSAKRRISISTRIFRDLRADRRTPRARFAGRPAKRQNDEIMIPPSARSASRETQASPGRRRRASPRPFCT